MDPTTVTVVAEQTIELQPIFDYIFNLLGVIIPPILLGVITIATNKWIKVKLDESSRQALEGALHKGATWALGKARDATSKVDVHTKNAAIAMAANYVVSSTPDALARFGITPDRLKELVEARVSEILLDKNTDIDLQSGA
jgi:hypothetical protein